MPRPPAFAHARAGKPALALHAWQAREVALHTVPPSNDPFYAGLGQAVRIGTELLAALIVGGGAGWLIDTYLLDSGPWGIVIGLVLGVVAGIRNAYRRAQKWTN